MNVMNRERQSGIWYCERFLLAIPNSASFYLPGGMGSSAMMSGCFPIPSPVLNDREKKAKLGICERFMLANSQFRHISPFPAGEEG